MMETGFSIAILLISTFHSRMKNEAEAACLPSNRLAGKCLAPETARLVHGGCAIIKSQQASTTSKTFP
jgi:hypothetical protein